MQEFGIKTNSSQRRMRIKNIGGGGAEYHVAVRPQQDGGCGKGDVLPPTQSTKKILLVYNLYGNNTV